MQNINEKNVPLAVPLAEPVCNHTRVSGGLSIRLSVCPSVRVLCYTYKLLLQLSQPVPILMFLVVRPSVCPCVMLYLQAAPLAEPACPHTHVSGGPSVRLSVRVLCYTYQLLL